MEKVLSVILAAFLIINGALGALDKNHTMAQPQEVLTRVKRRPSSESKPTGLEEFTWTAHLDITFNSYVFNSIQSISSFCGGSLIGDFYVLTAAHCLSSPKLGYNLQSIQVTLAEHNKRTPTDCTTLPHFPWTKCIQNIPVTAEGYRIHSQYVSSYLHNDIALVRLPGQEPFTKYVPRIQLPDVDIDGEKYMGFPLRVIGWGTNGLYYPDIKQSAVLNLVPHKLCQRYYPDKYLSSSQICAIGNNGENACEGDSGGPLVAKTRSGHYMLVGIVSTGSGKPCSVGPSIFTNVHHYLNWIKLTMADYENNRLYKKYLQ